MKLTSPVIITSRLLPGVRVGGAEIHIEYSKRVGCNGRARYQWTIDLPGGASYSGDDLQSGCQGGTLQGGLYSLLCFLGAAAESWSYHGAEGENSDLFPQPVVEWAAQNSDEIGMLQMQLEEQPSLIEE